MTSTPKPRPELIDLSHTVHDGLVTYPGPPAPVITDHLSRQASRSHYADGVEFHIGRIELVANTGTYVDAPFHRYPDGADLGAFPLTALAALPGTLVHATGNAERGVAAAAFQDLEVSGRAVLVHTGWDVYWGTSRYGQDNPFLTEAAASYLANAGAALVGIDSLNVDDPADSRRPAHSILLGASRSWSTYVTSAQSPTGRLPSSRCRSSSVGLVAFRCAPSRCANPSTRRRSQVGAGDTPRHGRTRHLRPDRDPLRVAGELMSWRVQPCTAP
jgi:arylformamidase